MHRQSPENGRERMNEEPLCPLLGMPVPTAGSRSVYDRHDRTVLGQRRK